MKVQERYIWIAVLILVGFFIQTQEKKNETLETLVTTYGLEAQIQNQQIMEFNNELHAARDNSYVRGFEAGKTQAGIALAKGDSLYEYKDGYHAALTQQVEEAAVLEVSEGLMFELNSLRKMVPRLLKQNEESDALWEMLFDVVESEDNADEVYLEIIDTLLAEPSLTEETPTPIEEVTASD